ncbi:elongation factor P 5-aminopentanone reductase [Kallipyga massiliensis]|uniref:elongation factor P 5-aminopentanone reductase n=1 Tax=Kallipyga massiliensis TaxID=1472764 RepID=UPI0004AE1C19|nr:3-oxoacyl-ACP reductase FabG [Kallipyga massiliensis]
MEGSNMRKMETIFITGGSRGIGRATALRMAGPDRKLALLYRQHEDEAQEVAALCREKGAETLLLQADVSDFDGLSEAFGQVNRTFGGVDVLVNNAGVSTYGMVQDITPQEWNRVFSVNVNGYFYATKLALPHMVDQKWGRIINISSVWGMVGASCESLYAATKGAIIAFTKSCAKELAYSGITCNCIAPGMVDTPMMEELDEESIRVALSEIPLGRMVKPEEVALWVDHFASKEAEATTGQVLSPNGGWII